MSTITQGIYRIRYLTPKDKDTPIYLTHFEADPKTIATPFAPLYTYPNVTGGGSQSFPFVVAVPKASNSSDTTQLWIVKYYKGSNTYTFKNVQSGLYMIDEYPTVGYSSIVGSYKAQHWEIPQVPKVDGQFWIQQPGTNWPMMLCDNNAPRGLPCMWTRFGDADARQIYQFERDDTEGLMTKRFYGPRTYLESGIYEIGNLSSRNPLSIEQSSAANDDFAVVDGARTKGNSPQIQQFMVMREPTSGAYLIQNVATNRYVTSKYPSAAGAEIVLSKVGQYWDIRPAEHDSTYFDLFVIQLPFTPRVIDLNAPNYVLAALTGTPGNKDQHMYFKYIGPIPEGHSEESVSSWF